MHDHPLAIGKFSTTRMRRNRQKLWSRQMISEHSITTDDLVWPCFLREEGIDSIIKLLPDVKRYTITELLHKLEEVVKLNIRAIMLFPIIMEEKRNNNASEALNEKNLLLTAIRAIKLNFPNLGIISDVALDPYTSHGQDGLVMNDIIDNDATLKIIEKQAIMHGQAGVDIIAPSDMMDGRVQVIRQALDTQGMYNTGIMSYAAKFASCLYDPFRDAIDSQTRLGKANKFTYQLDPANSQEALREVAIDISEGADMIIVKPGLPYLDIVHQVNHMFKIPTLAFHVSAEYAMLKIAAQSEIIDYSSAIQELAICFKRAGCRAIITYAAIDLAIIIKQQAGVLKIVT